MKCWEHYTNVRTEEILSAKRKRRRDERIWRKSKLTVHQEIYHHSCLLVK